MPLLGPGTDLDAEAGGGAAGAGESQAGRWRFRAGGARLVAAAAAWSMGSFRGAARAAGRGTRGLGRRPLRALAVASCVAIGFALVGAAHLAVGAAAAVEHSWQSGAGMIVYLDDGVSPAQAARIARALATLPAVERVRYVPPERALDQVRDLLGPGTDVAANLRPGMLPGSLEVELRPGALDVVRAHPVVARLQRTPGVDEVAFADDWVGRVSGLTGAVERAGGIAGWLATLACVWILLVVVRLGWASGDGGGWGRRNRGTGAGAPARAWYVAGASRWFVSAPLAVEGAVIGAVGAALGLLVLALLFAMAHGPAETALAAAFGAPVPGLHFLAWGEIARLVGLGAVVGAAAGASGGHLDAHALA